MIVFDRKSGRPVSLRVGGHELLADTQCDYLFDHNLAWIDHYKYWTRGVFLEDYKNLDLEELKQLRERINAPVPTEPNLEYNEQVEQKAIQKVLK